MHPWLPFLFARRKRLSDIEFLSIKDFDGKLRKNEGDVSVTGDLATLTASSGKDMYIARAKIIFRKNIVTSSIEDITSVVALKINGTTVEKARWMWQAAASASAVYTFEYEFRNIGHKVAATQIINLDVTVLDTQSDVSGFIECFEEDTGVSPQIG